MNYDDFNNYDYEYFTELNINGEPVKYRLVNGEKQWASQDYIFGKSWCGLPSTRFTFNHSSYCKFYKIDQGVWPEIITSYYCNIPEIEVDNILVLCPNCVMHSKIEDLKNAICSHCGAFLNIKLHN